MEVTLNIDEIEVINKTLSKKSIDYSTEGYQYFEVPLKGGSVFNSFFDEIHISLMVESDNALNVEYCQLVNTDERDSMEITNWQDIKLLEDRR